MSDNDIFLSYARRDDEPFVKKLFADLNRLGRTPWYDREHMTNDGTPFTQSIGDAITDATHFLFIVGAGSVGSKYCLGELDRAMRQCKVIIPIVRLGDYAIIPAHIQAFHAVDFRDDTQYADKITELHRLLGDPVRPLTDIPKVPLLPQVVLPRTDYLDPLKEAIRTGDPLVVTSHQEVAHLVGVGGIGKTTLASLLCHDCAVRRTFTQIFWINAGPTHKNQASVAQLMQNTIGGNASDFDGYETARTTFAGRLVGQKTLIVLDDVWSHEVAKGFLFSGVDCRLVITTRQKRLSSLLGVKVKDVPVDKLSDADAHHLLLQTAGRDSLEHADDILKRFDGHALAITLAGLWLKNKPHQTGADLYRRLQKASKFETLTLAEGDKNLNLELALRLSYDDLSADSQRHYRALGIFAPAGTADARAVSAVWGIDDPDAGEDALDVLVGAGLLDMTTDGRYEQHPLLRAYAHALAHDHAENPTWAERHFGHYHRLHSDFDANQDETRHVVITPDFPDILTAVAWAFVHAGGQACDWVNALDYYMMLHSTTDVRQALRQQALTTARALDDKRLMADALRGLGEVAGLRADYEGAVGYYREAAGLYEVIGDRRGRADALCGLGEMARMRDDDEGAVGYYREAAGLYEAVGSRLGRATALLGLGDVAGLRADYEGAVGYYNEAAGLYEAIGARLGRANALRGLGEVARMRADYERAVGYYNDAVGVYEAVGDRLGRANALLGLGEVAVILADYEGAVGYYSEAVGLYEAVGARLGRANALLGLGHVARMQDDYPTAKTHYETALALYVSIGDFPGQLNSHSNLARLARAQGDMLTAKRHYEALFALGDTHEMYKNHPSMMQLRREYEALG